MKILVVGKKSVSVLGVDLFCPFRFFIEFTGGVSSDDDSHTAVRLRAEAAPQGNTRAKLWAPDKSGECDTYAAMRFGGLIRTTYFQYGGIFYARGYSDVPVFETFEVFEIFVSGNLSLPLLQTLLFGDACACTRRVTDAP